MEPQVQISKMVFSLTNKDDFFEFCKTNHYKDMRISDKNFNYSDGEYYYCDYIYKTGKHLSIQIFKSYFFKKLNSQNEFLLLGSKLVDCDDRPDPETSIICYFEPTHISNSKIITILPDLECRTLTKVTSGYRSEYSIYSTGFEYDFDDYLDD